MPRECCGRIGRVQDTEEITPLRKQESVSHPERKGFLSVAYTQRQSYNLNTGSGLKFKMELAGVNKEKALLRELTRLRKRQNPSVVDLRRMRRCRRIRSVYWTLLKRRYGYKMERAPKKEKVKAKKKERKKKEEKPPKRVETEESAIDEELFDEEFEELYAADTEETTETSETEGGDETEVSADGDTAEDESTPASES